MKPKTEDTGHAHASGLITDAERQSLQDQARKDAADAERVAQELDRQASDAVNRVGEEQAAALADAARGAAGQQKKG